MNYTIFCLPYAGGAASAYGDFKKIGRQMGFNIVPIELSGHASRIKDGNYNTFDDAVDDCYEIIRTYLNNNLNNNYAIFGHSMGSWLAYEIANKLIESDSVKNPDKLFFSANHIPQSNLKEKASNMPDDMFWEYIYKQGGLEEELYNTKEFKEYFLPIIRHDYKLLENYSGNKVKKRYFDVDMYVLSGTQDNVSESQLNLWKQFAKKKFEIKWFEGDHFYFKDNPEKVMEYVFKKINE